MKSKLFDFYVEYFLDIAICGSWVLTFVISRWLLSGSNLRIAVISMFVSASIALLITGRVLWMADEITKKFDNKYLPIFTSSELKKRLIATWWIWDINKYLPRDIKNNEQAI